MAYRTLLTTTLALACAAASTALAASPGETLFQQRCSVCHSIEPAAGKMGPPLKGVIGRPAGSVAGYAYSDGMKKAHFTWTSAQVDSFLKSPGQLVPGTKMMVSIGDAQQRAALATYLASQSPAKTRK
jgi:cytochrome c